MFEHILVPLDGSRCAALAVPVAADLARQFGSTLTLLHVVPGLPAHLTLSRGLDYDYVAHHARQVEEGHRLLEEARVHSGPDLTGSDLTGSHLIRTVCLDDTGLSVAGSIAQQIGVLGSELVVMGTHSRHGLSRLLQGSVAGAVLHAVSVPVLLVQAPESPAPNEVPAENEVPAPNEAPHADDPAPPEAATS